MKLDRFELASEMLIDPRAMARQTADGLFLDWLFGGRQREHERDGKLGIVAISGPLGQRGGWFEGYDTVRARFESALGDPEVEVVLLRIDSPGGVVSGCFDACAAMLESKRESGKKVVAYADELAASGAYALACVADEIVLPRTGTVGSVGALTTLVEFTEAFKNEGIRAEVIKSGRKKAQGHPFVPLDEETIRDVRARIDTVAEHFAEHVATSRKMTAKAVLKLEAAVYQGEDAVAIGLADRVESFDSLRATLANGEAKTPRTAASSKETKMSFKAIFAALGLPETASEADAIKAIGESKGFEREVMSRVDAKSPGEAMGAIEALKVKAERQAETEAKLAEHTKAAEKTARESSVDAAIADGRLAPAKRDAMLELGEKHGAVALNAALGALEPIFAAPAGKGPVDPSTKTRTAVDAEGEKTLARFGLTAEEFGKFAPQAKAAGWL